MHMNLRANEGQAWRAGAWFLSLCLLAAAPSASCQNTEPDIRRDATVIAVEKVMPSVVNIATEEIIRVHDPLEEIFRQFWDPYHRRLPPNSQYSLGSGVVIDEAGYLLTNDHVVQRADKIAVKFCTGTNLYEATVVASDPKSDVALLKLKAQPGERFSAIKFAQEDDLLLGETVLALGNPFGLGGSVTRGILSSKSRTVGKEGEPMDINNWLQTDAPINFGNSGGPLVNLRGELIGINVAVLRNFQGQLAEGIGFAIPIRRVLEALSDIIPTEFVKSLWFGARVKVGTQPLVVMNVQLQSPAGQAGLKPGDAILQVNGKAPKSFIDFTDLLASSASHKVSLKIQRGNSQKEVTASLVPEQTVFNPALIRDKLGLNLEDVPRDVAERYRLNSSACYIITGVIADGPAAASGLQNGMLVTAIDGRTPPDLTTAAKQLYKKQAGDRVTLDVVLPQPRGNFIWLRNGSVELTVR
jgi:serine protease Do